MDTPHPPSVMFIIDMQAAALRDDPGVAELAEQIAAHVAQHRYDLVIATRFVNEPGSNYERLIGNDLRTPAETTLLDTIAPLADMVVVKSTYSALDEGLVAELRGRSIRRVHVCGVDTDQCVLATVLALFDAGFEPIVHANLCRATSGETCHEAGLVALRRAVGEQRVL